MKRKWNDLLMKISCASDPLEDMKGSRQECVFDKMLSDRMKKACARVSEDCCSAIIDAPHDAVVAMTRWR